MKITFTFFDGVKREKMDLFLLLYNPITIGILAVIIYAVVIILRNIAYKKSAYYNVTHLPYGMMRSDSGRYGEYLSYLSLKRFERNGAKFLFNVYIPKENGETTEIDVLMICSNGIYVIECKNYSGWIFGSEDQLNWYQTLPTGRMGSHKEKFFNPIIQNRNHIKHLKKLIGERFSVFSIVAFSDKCTVKNLQMSKHDTVVTKFSYLGDAAFYVGGNVSGCGLSEGEIIEVYEKLYPYSQVDSDVKSRHIENIENIEKRTNRTTYSGVGNIFNTQDTMPCESQCDVDESESPQTVDAKPCENDVVTELDIEKDTSSDVSQGNLSENDDSTVAEKEENAMKVENPVTNDPNSLKCPICGGALVLKKAMRGANAGRMFYGCSNYPKCRYIRNISDKTTE